MTEEDSYNKLRLKCHENSFHVFGHGYIFDKRAQIYGRLVSWLKVFGILVPATVGATAIGYGYDNNILKSAIAIAIPITIIQFIFSVLAVIYKWDDELSYSFEASQDYNSLYRKFKKLADFPPESYSELNAAFDLLDTEYNSRSQQDSKHNVQERELRRGMRFSLREHKRACVGCRIIPVSMHSTNCDVCGKFSFKYLLKF